MIRRIENLVAKLLELVNADCSDGFGDRLAPRCVDVVDVDEFVEWHIYLRWIDSLGCKGRIVRAKKVIDHIGDSGEAVHTAELAIDAFVAEPIPH